MDIMVEDSSDHALIPILPAGDVVGMDICEVCEAVALPGNLVRLTCTCQHKCVERVMQGAEPLVRHLRGEVRDKHFLLEFVKHALLPTNSTCGRLQGAGSALMRYPGRGFVRS